MKSNICVVFLVILLLSSCSQTGRLGGRKYSSLPDKIVKNGVCESLQKYDSQYISKAEAVVYLGEDQYKARVSMYYIPDSVIFISAVNSGFEIVRIGILQDSIVYINRLDKVVYIKLIDDISQAPPPMIFRDLEYLLNRRLVCDESEKKQTGDYSLLVDRSIKDITRKIFYAVDDLAPNKFEFFQKKTGEYIVGEYTADSIFVIYSNYIVKNLKIEAWGGIVDYNRIINVDLGVNRNKYDIYYF